MEPAFVGISHLDLSVSDVETSASWYERVLALRRIHRVDFPTRTMIVLVHEGTGLIVGLNQHQGIPDEPFDERHAGLDHVGFAVGSRAELDGWQARLADLGVEHSPVADTEAGAALVFRDPDHIQLELWWTKPQAIPATTGRHGLVEHLSSEPVAETVQRLVNAAEAHGVTVFATVDHAAGARSVGMDLPDTQVLILGNPRRGTPVMQAAPEMALDLPTRLLVRAAPPGSTGSTVSFHDPVNIGRKHGLSPSLVEELQGIVAVVDDALALPT